MVDLESGRALDQSAVDAWLLAEVLRQGAGAETVADDLRFACTIAWKPDDTSGLLAEFPAIERIPTPRAPGESAEKSYAVEVFEWLDRPISSAATVPASRARCPPWCWRASTSVGKRYDSRVRGREPRTNRGAAFSAARS